MQSPAKLDDIDGSLDDLVNKLRTLKEQDMYMSSTLPNSLPQLLLLTSEARTVHVTCHGRKARGSDQMGCAHCSNE
jgi:hypothetical protein